MLHFWEEFRSESKIKPQTTRKHATSHKDGDKVLISISYLFFFLAEMLSCPESDSDPELELDELELLELLESELESDA